MPDGADGFFSKLGSPVALAEMFDFLPGVYLFVKDADHRYMKVNPSLAELHGCASPSEMIGKCDLDYNPPALAVRYVEEDRRVMLGGRPLVDQIWLVRDAKGMPHWLLSTKVPLRDSGGTVIGLAGVMRPMGGAVDAPGPYQRLARVCDHVLEHYAEPLAVAGLARLAHLSVSQLQREFRRLFGMSPNEYVSRVRLDVARLRLEQSMENVGRIALDCGFYDQSHFTRVFRRAMGMSPLEYRRRFSSGRKRVD